MNKRNKETAKIQLNGAKCVKNSNTRWLAPSKTLSRYCNLTQTQIKDEFIACRSRRQSLGEAKKQEFSRFERVKRSDFDRQVPKSQQQQHEVRTAMERTEDDVITEHGAMNVRERLFSAQRLCPLFLPPAGKPAHARSL